jgi:hypothetical protein
MKVAAAAGPQCARSLRHATASVEDSLLVNAVRNPIVVGCNEIAKEPTPKFASSVRRKR